MFVKVLQFLSILFTALTLVPAGAHVMEFAAKIGLDQRTYVTVQQLYRGWALSGIFLVVAVIANAALAYFSRGQMGPCYFAAAGAVLLLVTLVTFFVLIY